MVLIFMQHSMCERLWCSGESTSGPGPGWIPVVQLIYGFHLLLCLVLVLKVCLQILQFSSLHKRQLM